MIALPRIRTLPSSVQARWLIAASALLVIAVAGLGLRAAQSQREACQVPQEQAQVEQLAAAGDQAKAAGLAASVLVQPGLCAESRASLGQVWYAAQLQELLQAGAGQDASSLQTIDAQADAWRVPSSARLAPAQIAALAYEAGAWPIADAAWKQAWARSQPDANAIQLRYQLLRAWGLALHDAPRAADQDHGVTLLATAHRVAERFNLPNDDACDALKHSGFFCSQVLANRTEPLLTLKQK